MLLKYVVTGSAPFTLGGVTATPGDVIELPVQLAHHPVAMGALRPAPPDAEVAAGKPVAKPKTKRKTANA
ncbi:hypothetical protein [Hyphomicrobium sulfonivorans]|uniref:hypothetical protein n=1 Tax=Hyphomicrobium sulfonivorans TaxID=121290 RepID=UPI00156E59EF|nr:hypothetical protein [Hyphomicrobium sulfonivorans]MBI1649873.1 hypothetical protein [Hyphomicrobium sulfonivorans]NSL71784.1 hypothetical protein [Hyphomicrobium sulfonivorans]